MCIRDRLEPKQPILTIKNSLLLTSGDLKLNQFVNPDKKVLEFIYDYHKLKGIGSENSFVFNFLYHFAHIDHSIFKDVLLAISPNETVGALIFSDEELQLIKQDSFLYNTIRSVRKELYRKYRLLRETFEMTYTHEQRLAILGSTTISMADYLWAMSFLRTHAWRRDEDTVALVPIASLINSDPNTGFAFHEHNGFDQAGDAKVLAERVFAPDDEILTSYGKVPHTTYLLDYGFIPTSQLMDCHEISSLNATFFEQMKGPMVDLTKLFQFRLLTCLPAENDKEYFRLALMVMLLTMSEREQKECYINVKKRANGQEPLDLFLENCPRSYLGTSIIPTMIKELSERVEIYSDLIKKIEAYKETASEVRQTWIQTLHDYYKSRLNIGRKIVIKLKSFPVQQ
eukprot:TRINITY_DN6772_c0_g1_i5.p1 TRINITY_DN6772_c0_g1~~TRINITY_DN6772_c0_g1_i5.p1  ORF type:complete len:399 (+),score=46.49 TRINITY_DN6772_c0_g1_i5:64-1260(+)